MVMSPKYNLWSIKKKLNIMINFDKVTGANTHEYNPHRPQIPDYPYRILTTCRSGLEEKNSFNKLNK